MELSERSSFAGLVGRRVLDQSGRSLGHVYEARGRWQRDGSIAIESLLFGRRALWQRLRGPAAHAPEVPWEAIVEIREDAIVVRA